MLASCTRATVLGGRKGVPPQADQGAAQLCPCLRLAVHSRSLGQHSVGNTIGTRGGLSVALHCADFVNGFGIDLDRCSPSFFDRRLIIFLSFYLSQLANAATFVAFSRISSTSPPLSPPPSPPSPPSFPELAVCSASRRPVYPAHLPSRQRSCRGHRGSRCTKRRDPPNTANCS
jgi:hypothetical protein